MVPLILLLGLTGQLTTAVDVPTYTLRPDLTIELPSIRLVNTSVQAFNIDGFPESAFLDVSIKLMPVLDECAFYRRYFTGDQLEWNISIIGYEGDPGSSASLHLLQEPSLIEVLFSLLRVSLTCRDHSATLSLKNVPANATVAVTFLSSVADNSSSICNFAVAGRAQVRESFMDSTQRSAVAALLLTVIPFSIFVGVFIAAGGVAHDWSTLNDTIGIHDLLLFVPTVITAALLLPAAYVAYYARVSEIGPMEEIRPGAPTPPRYRRRTAGGAAAPPSPIVATASAGGAGAAAGALPQLAPSQVSNVAVVVAEESSHALPLTPLAAPHAGGGAAGGPYQPYPPSDASEADAATMPLLSVSNVPSEAAPLPQPPGAPAAAADAPVHLRDLPPPAALAALSRAAPQPTARGGTASTASSDVPACRICRETKDETAESLVAPCACTGSSRWVHMACLNQWRAAAAATARADVLDRCEVCHNPLRVPPQPPLVGVWLRSQTMVMWNLCVMIILVFATGCIVPTLLRPLSCRGVFASPIDWSQTFAYTLVEGSLYLHGMCVAQVRLIVWAWDILRALMPDRRHVPLSLAVLLGFGWIILTQIASGDAASRLIYLADPKSEWTGDVAPFTGAIAFYGIMGLIVTSPIAVMRFIHDHLAARAAASTAPSSSAESDSDDASSSASQRDRDTLRLAGRRRVRAPRAPDAAGGSDAGGSGDGGDAFSPYDALALYAGHVDPMWGAPPVAAQLALGGAAAGVDLEPSASDAAGANAAVIDVTGDAAAAGGSTVGSNAV